MDKELYEFLIRQSCSSYAEKETDEIIREFSHPVPFEPSPQFKRRIQQSKKIADNAKRRSFSTKKVRKIVLVAVVIAILLSFTVSVSAYRLGLLNFLLKNEENTHTSFRLSDTKGEYSNLLQALPSDWNGVYILEMPPFSNCEIQTDVLLDNVTISYIDTNSSSYLILQQTNVPDPTLLIDSETSPVLSVSVGKYEGYLSQRETSTTLIWTNNDYVFSITSSLPKETILLLGENIVKLSK